MMEEAGRWIVLDDENLKPLAAASSSNCNNRPFEGCLGLAIIKRWQAGSDEPGELGESRSGKGVSRMNDLGEVLIVDQQLGLILIHPFRLAISSLPAALTTTMKSIFSYHYFS